MNPYKNENLRKFIESIPQEEIDKQTKIQDEENKKLYKEFIENLKIGKCFLCGDSMNFFDQNNPCFHWFTNPKNIKKKHFKKYLQQPIGFFQLDSYFRWLANSEQPFRNINDLKEETSKASYLETTYKYKNLEWAFSVGHTDLEGHPNTFSGSNPHYHIQMKVDDKIFLKFNNFHIPFSDDDLFNIEVLNQAGDLVKFDTYLGHGMNVLDDPNLLEIIDDHMTVTDNEDNATFRRQTFIQVPEGKSISCEIIQKAFEESRKTNEPIGKILGRLLSDAKIQTIISPGDGVPIMSKRSGKK